MRGARGRNREVPVYRPPSIARWIFSEKLNLNCNHFKGQQSKQAHAWSASTFLT